MYVLSISFCDFIWELMGICTQVPYENRWAFVSPKPRSKYVCKPIFQVLLAPKKQPTKCENALILPYFYRFSHRFHACFARWCVNVADGNLGISLIPPAFFSIQTKKEPYQRVLSLQYDSLYLFVPRVLPVLTIWFRSLTTSFRKLTI